MQAYDAIQHGKYHKSFNNWYFNSRRLGEYKDLVAIYHSSSDSWGNVLTEATLVDICRAEQLFLESQPCVGSEVASLIDAVMDDNCDFMQSYEEALLAFGLEENDIYVEDNVDPSSPESAVVLSYYKTSCDVKLESVDETVEEVESTYGTTTHMAYAHSDLVTDAFVASGIHDVQLSLYAMLVCFGVLSVSVGLKFLYGILFILCIVMSLVIGAGALPLFGFSYFSAFNVLAIFVITGIGADAIIVFCSSWYKNFANAKFAAIFWLTNPADIDDVPQVDMLPLFPLVIYNSYTSVRSALTFTVMTTVLSFMANLVSPIIVIAQLGAFMGSAMIMYFILLHLVLIPAWVFVVKVDQFVSLWSLCLNCLSMVLQHLTLHHVPSWDWRRRTKRTHSVATEQDWNAASQLSNAKELLTRISRHSVGGAYTGPKFGLGDMELTATNLLHSSNALGDACPENGDEKNYTAMRVRETDFDYPDIFDNDDMQTNDESNAPAFEKQNVCWGLCVVFGVVVSTILIVYGITANVVTDFGLPVLLKEGTNMADLIYITKNFKSDLLSLKSSGSSSVPDPGTSSPTAFMTSFPTIISHSPSLSPVISSNYPSIAPSHSSNPTSVFSSNCPSITPSHMTSNHPTTVAQLASDGDTLYTVYVCHGIDIGMEFIDSEPEAKVNHETFGRYAEVGGLLADIKALCDYLASNKVYMEVAMVNSECLYEELMAVTVEDINIFERIGLWMAAERDRMYQVGVEETGQGVVSGNFGEELDLWLTWICQPISCRADISSFFSKPDHALTMIDRWDYALYDVGSASAESMDVVPLTGSEAWLFPLLSDRIVSSIYVSASISFVGCLLLIVLAKRNLKLSLLIGFGMLFVMVTSLFIHALFFSSVIDVIDVIVLISFVGIIIDYPTHMALHFEQGFKLRRKFAKRHINNRGIDDSVISPHADSDDFFRRIFGYMRVALLGPALTTILSAVPLLFADFSIISKAGEYVVIMCACTYVYVAFVMPSILIMIGEILFFPCRYDSTQFVRITTVY